MIVFPVCPLSQAKATASELSLALATTAEAQRSAAQLRAALEALTPRHFDGVLLKRGSRWKAWREVCFEYLGMLKLFFLLL